MIPWRRFYIATISSRYHLQYRSDIAEIVRFIQIFAQCRRDVESYWIPWRRRDYTNIIISRGYHGGHRGDITGTSREHRGYRGYRHVRRSFMEIQTNLTIYLLGTIVRWFQHSTTIGLRYCAIWHFAEYFSIRWSYKNEIAIIRFEPQANFFLIVQCIFSWSKERSRDLSYEKVTKKLRGSAEEVARKLRGSAEEVARKLRGSAEEVPRKPRLVLHGSSREVAGRNMKVTGK
jgi:hypothetical protein